MKKILILFLLLSFCSQQLKSKKETNEPEEVSVCYNISFFKKKCFLLIKNNDNSIADIMFYVNGVKPKRSKDAFYNFDFFKKINFFEAKKYAIKTCEEIKGEVEYFELSYNKFLNISTSGSLDIWCKKTLSEMMIEEKKENNNNTSKKNVYEYVN